MTKHQLPTSQDLLWPTLKALEAHGGSASIQELLDHIAQQLALSDEILDIPHEDGPQSKVGNRAGWARTDLKLLGAVNPTSRGVWTITKFGRGVQTERELRKLHRQRKAKDAKSKNQTQGSGLFSPEHDDDDTTTDQSWQDTLLQIVRGMSPDGFERLCQRVLRESGFIKVEVTGRTGDGGIDGAGVLRINLISFHIRFQCKRYAGSVGAPEIRDFRGAVSGQADKGLFITTGRFTKDAEREAVRPGGLAIDLIDGVDFCDLLKNLEIGTETVVMPKPEFFESL